MGGNFGSKPRPPFFDEQWLQMDLKERENDLEFINSYTPKGEGQQHLRILLHGLAGAGKSSFINSVTSVLEGKISVKAPVCNNESQDSQEGFTKEYKTYTIKKGKLGDILYPLVLNDMTGVSNTRLTHRRVHVKDVKKAMKGRMKDGYKFNPENALSKTLPSYNEFPTVNDKVHVLVSVFDANKVNLLGEKVLEIIKEIRYEAKELGIPHVAILTKIDEFCPELKNDVKNVCSGLLQKKVKKFSKLTGIPENCIFPVKNYRSEIKLDNETDARILSALRRMIEIGEEYLDSSKGPD